MPIPRCLLARSYPHLRHGVVLTRSRVRQPSNPVNHRQTQATSFRTKQDAVSRGTTSRPTAIASLLDWFSHSQNQRPYLTQLCLTPLIFCLGDFSAQLIGNDNDNDFDYYRSLRSVIIGLVIAIPSHEWFLFLGRRFNYRSSALSLGAKVAANQAFYTPLFNVYFFASHGLLAGEGFGGAIERVKEKASISIPRSFLFWPVVTAFNFTYVKPQSRSIVTSIFSVFWQSYLSWLNSSAGRG